MSDWNAPGDPHRQQPYPPAQGWSGGPSYSPGPGAPGQPWSPPGQPQWSAGAPQPAPAAGPQKSPRPLLIGIAIGLAVAVLVGAVLVVTKVVHFGSSSSSSAAVDTRPITLPDSLNGLTNYAAAIQAKAGSSGKSGGAMTTNEHMVSLTQTAYQEAFGGAAASVRTYATADLMGIYTVIAVRAAAHGVVNGPVNNPADLGIARNQQTIETIGDQQCNVVSLEVVASGKTVDNNQLLTSACQRTGSDLTVWAFGGGVDGPAGQAQITGLVDAAYASVSAGK